MSVTIGNIFEGITKGQKPTFIEKIEIIENLRENKINPKTECGKYNRDEQKCKDLNFCNYSKGIFWNSCKVDEWINEMKEIFCENLNNEVYFDEVKNLAIAIGFESKTIDNLSKAEICDLLSVTDNSMGNILEDPHKKIGYF